MSESSPMIQLPPMSALQKYCGDTVVPCKGVGGVKLTDVNPHLVCVLCHGYFVDATSIVECLHSFCRSCIVLHLDKQSFCPICQEEIQNSKALKPDKALQDIVYKLVPGLFHSEMKRRQEFYQKHPERDMYLHPESRGVSVDRILYTADELISLSLEYYDKECEKEMWKNVTDNKGLHYIVRTDKSQRCVVRKRYLKCPAAVRMSHLKKFIRMKYNLKPTDFVELLYRRESLPDEYSIMDIAYIYTWNRNEPMRFLYKINACVVVPIMPQIKDKCFTDLTDTVTSESSKLPKPKSVRKISLPLKVKNTNPLNSVVDIKEGEEIEKENTVPDFLKLSTTDDESVEVKSENVSKAELSLKESMVAIVKEDQTNSRSTPPPSIVVSTVSLNPPISPEGTSRKENVSDNVRNSYGNEPIKSPSADAVTMEEKKTVDFNEQHKTSTTNDVPMKKLEKLVDQQQRTPPITTDTTETVSPPSILSLPKKTIGGSESKLNLSISKLIMKNQNASAATKFVPTLQQMQQIGMHTSIPTVQQQQQQQLLPPYPNAYVRPGFPGMQPFKRTQDQILARSQAPTNRPPFIPVRKSYEWNKARNLAAKPTPSPIVTPIKDNKINEKSSMKVMEKPTKKMSLEKTPTTVPTSYMMAKNSDEMNAAQSLLKVGQDLRLVKPPMITNLHDKYNCESSLQITKVTEPETNQPLVTHEKQSNSQPSLQIMRVPPTADKSTKHNIEAVNVNNSSNTALVNKPVNKKPVPNLYSMPTKRIKDDQHHNSGIDNKRIERRVDTENGVLSVSLLTETSKQDMDAKRREIVQPDVSIKLMTFSTESGKKTPEINGNIGSTNNKRKQDEPYHSGGGSGAIKRKHEEPNTIVIPNKTKHDEPNTIGGLHSKKKLDESNIGANNVSSANSKRKQDEPERKVTPQRPTPTKDDVPQLIEINSSPYAKLLPSKKPILKQPPIPKKQTLASAKVLDLSKSPPNVGVKRSAAPDSPSDGCSPMPSNKIKMPSPVQLPPPSISTSAVTAAAINSNLLFAAQRQAAAFLLKQHFDSINNGLMHNGGKGPAEWPRAMFNPALFRPPTNLNN